MDPSTLQLPENWEFVHDEPTGLRYYYDGNVGVSQWAPPAAARTSDGMELTASQIAELSFDPTEPSEPATPTSGEAPKQEAPESEPMRASPAAQPQDRANAGAGGHSDSGSPAKPDARALSAGATVVATALADSSAVAPEAKVAGEPGAAASESSATAANARLEAAPPVPLTPLRKLGGAVVQPDLDDIATTAAVVYRGSNGQTWVAPAEGDRLGPFLEQLGLTKECDAKLVPALAALDQSLDDAKHSPGAVATSPALKAFAKAFEDSGGEGDGDVPTDEEEDEEEAPALAADEVPEPLRFRAIIKLDGTVFYQNLLSKSTAWELPTGGVVVERARQKPPAMPLMAMRAVAKFKRLGKAAAAAKAAAKVAAVRRNISGWLYKTRDMSKGSAPRWRKRFVELDWENKKLRYYSKDPSVTLQRYGVQEPQKGELDLTGAKLELTLTPPPGGPGTTGIEVLAGGRRTFLSQAEETGRREPPLKLWLRVVQSAVSEGDKATDADSTSPAAALQRRAKAGARDKVAAMADAAFAFGEAAAQSDCHISSDGHRWIHVRASVRPGPRMLLLTPMEDLGLEMQLPGATITTSVSLQGAAVAPDSKTTASARSVVFTVTEARDSSRPVKLMLQQSLTTTTLMAAIEAVSQLPPPKPDVLREVLGGDQGEGAVVQVDGWKTNANGVGWRRRRVQLALDGRLFRYLVPVDAAAADSSELRDSLAKNIVELEDVSASDFRVVAGTGNSSMPPAPLALRVNVRDRVYTFCFPTDEEFAEMFAGFSLIAAAKSAGAPLARLRAAMTSSAADPTDPEQAERETRAALGSVAALDEASSAVDAARRLVAEAGRVIASAGSSRAASTREGVASAGSSTAEGSRLSTPTQTENPAFAIKAVLAAAAPPTAEAGDAKPDEAASASAPLLGAGIARA